MEVPDKPRPLWWTILRALLWTGGALLLLFGLLIGAMYVLPPLEFSGGHWAPSVMIKDEGYLSRLQQVQREARENRRVSYEFGHHAHQLTSGTGSALIYRWYSTGDLDAIDDELMESLTIWFRSLPQPPEGKISLDRPDLFAIYTRGGNAWPDAHRTGVVRGGMLNIVKDGDDYEVQIRGTAVPVPVDGCGWHDCEPIPLNLEFTAEATDADKLIESTANRGPLP